MFLVMSFVVCTSEHTWYSLCDHTQQIGLASQEWFEDGVVSLMSVLQLCTISGPLCNGCTVATA
jgi:hypothetical protein